MQGEARVGALVAGAAGALLLLSLFLSWFHVESASFDIREAYGVESQSFEGLETEYTYTGQYLDTLADEQDKDRDASAWSALVPTGRFLLLLTALAGLGLGGAMLAGAKVPRGASLALVALGVVTVVFLLYRTINPPDILGPVSGLVPEGIDLNVDVSRRVGLWLGLLCSIAVTVGAFFTLPRPAGAQRARPSR